jgi:carbon monoxide dehydrogenase subunit G
MSLTPGPIIALVAAVLLLPIIGILGYAATLPDTFRVTRSLSMAAPPDRIFPLINDLKQMNRWNPFAKQDPTIDIVYRGPASGKGANYSWTGSKAGEGSLEIVDSTMPSSVSMRLEMTKPMASHNAIVFSLEPKGSTTDVNWTMTGDYPYIAKVMGVIFNMDKMIGGEFDRGLADLKSLVG